MEIAFVNSGSFKTDPDATPTTMTLSHTIAAGDNRILIVVVHSRKIGSTHAISGVTYGGVSLTQLFYSSSVWGANYGRIGIYYLVAPAVGTADIVVTCNTGVYAAFVAANYTGVKQDTPFSSTTGNQATAAGTNVHTTTTLADSWILDMLAKENSTGTPAATAGQNQRARINSTGTTAANQAGAGISDKPGGTSVTTSWGWTGAYPYYHVSVEMFVGTNIKTINGVTHANTKTVSGLSIASVKSVGGLS